MTPPRNVLVAIARAVEAEGGDMDDVDDLIDAWERLAAQQGPLVDRLRYEAANPVCRCADGGIRASEGRCERCYGLLGRTTR